MMHLSKSDAATRDIGRRLGEKLKSGDVVALYGELGAGKTTMVKGIASALGISERDITSASFTIIAEHHGTVPFYHIDLYRVTPGEVQDLGLDEYLGSRGVAVIEWAEQAEEELPGNCIRVRLNYAGETAREIDIQGMTI